VTDIPEATPVSPEPRDPFVRGRRAPWSLTAVAAFILSFLLALAPLGVLLGIVGIFRTSGGRRRGMGLSIAAIPIGLVVSAVTGLVCFAIAIGHFANEARKPALVLLKSSSVQIERKASELFDEMSARFKVASSKEGFQAWAKNVASEFGTLQGLRIERTKPFDTTDDGMRIRAHGEFSNGAAEIVFLLAHKSGFTFEIDDIIVDGKSAAKAAAIVASDNSD
jgi:hypothetical protein